MPTNVVKTPEQERLWNKAKALAEKEGRAKEYAYVMGIFKRMGGLNKSMVGSPFRGQRIPGQVPSKAAMEALKVAQTPARPMTTQRLLDHGQDARPTIESIVRGLGFSQQEENDWKAYLAQALGAANGAVLARSFMAKAKDLDPVLRLALFQRVQRYRKDHQAMTKSGPVQILRPEDIRAYNSVTRKSLVKAEARGGKYHRRIPRASGKGFRYIYSPEDYAKRADAHTGGEDNAKVYLGSGIAKCLKAAGGSCGPDAFKSLVKRYGAKRVAEALRDGQKSGMIAFKKGKFSLAKPKD